MFIEKLEETLKQKHLTMNKLAKAIDFSQSATSQWKKGRMPQIDVLKKNMSILKRISGLFIRSGRDTATDLNRSGATTTGTLPTMQPGRKRKHLTSGKCRSKQSGTGKRIIKFKNRRVKDIDI